MRTLRTFACCLIFLHYALAVIPPYIKLCRISDPNVSKCIINSVYELKPKLAEGIPELNVPSIEPLTLDEVKLRSGPASAKIDANITNIKVWGPSSFEVLELKTNIPKSRFAFRVKIPYLRFEGDYDIDMNVLILKYKGQGPITGNFTNYSADCILKGTKVKQNGEEHLKFDKMQIRLTLGKSWILLGNLFKDDPLLYNAIRGVVDDNTDLFINEIKPALENALAEKFTEIANIITTTFSYKELFLP